MYTKKRYSILLFLWMIYVKVISLSSVKSCTYVLSMLFSVVNISNSYCVCVYSRFYIPCLLCCLFWELLFILNINIISIHYELYLLSILTLIVQITKCEKWNLLLGQLAPFFFQFEKTAKETEDSYIYFNFPKYDAPHVLDRSKEVHIYQLFLL